MDGAGCRWNVLAVLAVVALVGLAACEDRKRNEARLLIERVEAIDHDAPVSERRPRIEALKHLAITDEEVARAKDACVDAHEALLTAEVEQSRARHELEQATGGNPDAKTIAPQKARSIAQAIQRSNAAVERARGTFPRCQRDVRALSLRYRSTGR